MFFEAKAKTETQRLCVETSNMNDKWRENKRLKLWLCLKKRERNAEGSMMDCYGYPHNCA